MAPNLHRVRPVPEFCDITRNGFMCIGVLLKRAMESRDWNFVQLAMHRSEAGMNAIDELMRTKRDIESNRKKQDQD